MLLGVVAVSFALQLWSHHSHVVSSLMRTVPMSWTECIPLMLVSCIPLLVLELVKVMRIRRKECA